MQLAYPLPAADYAAVEGIEKSAVRAARHFVKVFVYADVDPLELVGAGSGIVVDELGHVVTAAHIVRSDGHRAFVKNMNGTTLPADIIAVEPEKELALLRIAIRTGSPTPPEINDRADAGQGAFAIGAGTTHGAVVTAGRVRTSEPAGDFRHGAFGFTDPVLLDMPVDTGYSGGPVFDGRQRLIGMIIGFDAGSSEEKDGGRAATAYAIPARRLYDFYYRWR